MTKEKLNDPAGEGGKEEIRKIKREVEEETKEEQDEVEDEE